MHIKSFYDIDVCNLDGKITRLEAYRGSIVMVVNIASECGFNEQLSEMEACYQSLKSDGFVILAFPSDQFKQEPLEDNEIQAFNEERFQVTFPIFKKVYVNGESAHPLFRYLCTALPGIFGSRSIKWNFTKFIIGRDGTPLKRFSPITHSEVVVEYVRHLLDLPPKNTG